MSNSAGFISTINPANFAGPISGSTTKVQDALEQLDAYGQMWIDPEWLVNHEGMDDSEALNEAIAWYRTKDAYGIFLRNRVYLCDETVTTTNDAQIRSLRIMGCGAGLTGGAAAATYGSPGATTVIWTGAAGGVLFDIRAPCVEMSGINFRDGANASILLNQRLESGAGTGFWSLNHLRFEGTTGTTGTTIGFCIGENNQTGTGNCDVSHYKHLTFSRLPTAIKLNSGQNVGHIFDFVMVADAIADTGTGLRLAFDIQGGGNIFVNHMHVVSNATQLFQFGDETIAGIRSVTVNSMRTDPACNTFKLMAPSATAVSGSKDDYQGMITIRDWDVGSHTLATNCCHHDGNGSILFDRCRGFPDEESLRVAGANESTNLPKHVFVRNCGLPWAMSKAGGGSGEPVQCFASGYDTKCAWSFQECYWHGTATTNDTYVPNRISTHQTQSNRWRTRGNDADVLPEAVTAVADPGTTLTDYDSNYITVTSSSSAYVVTLPTAVVGRYRRGWVGSNGFKMWAQGASVKINDIVCSATNEAVIPANTKFLVECVSTTQWILTCTDETGQEYGVIPTAR